MDNRKMMSELLKIVAAMKKAGYDPINQLNGYLGSGDSSYITRKEGARDAIEHVDKNIIRKYLISQRED